MFGEVIRQVVDCPLNRFTPALSPFVMYFAGWGGGVKIRSTQFSLAAFCFTVVMIPFRVGIFLGPDD